MGYGDADLTQAVKHPISSQKIMIAGIHNPLPYEEKFITEHQLRTCSPQAVKAGAESVTNWIKTEKIEYLAIHLDLDVLDPNHFRSILFAKPERGEHDFGDVAEGKLNIPNIINLINIATSTTTPVGLTIAEHLPWDAMNLKNMLNKLPLLSS